MPVPDHPSSVNEWLSSLKVDNNKGEVIKNRAATGPGLVVAPVARGSRLKPAWPLACTTDVAAVYE